MGQLSLSSFVISYFLIFLSFSPLYTCRILTQNSVKYVDIQSNPFANIDMTFFEDGHSVILPEKEELSHESAPLISIENSIEDEEIQSNKDVIEDRWSPTFFFENITYIMFIISGLILGFCGISLPKLSLSIFSLYGSHYMILFFCSILGVYDYHNISQQLALFFGMIFLAFTLSIVSFFYKHSQFLVISLGITSALCCIILDFVLNVNNEPEKLIFLGTYVGLLIVFFILTLLSPYTCLLILSSLTGSIMTVLNIAILTNYIQSFQTFTFIPEYVLNHALYLSISTCVLFVISALIQYFFRSKKRTSANKASADADKLEKTVVS